jgi:hypothetical protein
MFSQVHRMIARHGKDCTYKVVTEGTYDVNTSSATNTETEYTLKIYKKNIRVNQFNYPNLVGKDVSMFYLSGLDLVFIPESGDYIEYESDTYKVESVQGHVALGTTELYRIVGVK